MELVRAIKHRVTRNPTPDPKQIRGFKPVKNEQVASEPGPEGGLVLSAPLEIHLSRFFLILSKKMKNLPDSKTFALDPVGAFVWELCDGTHTVDNISKSLQVRYKMNRLEAETALAAYLQTLAGKKLITLQRGETSNKS